MDLNENTALYSALENSIRNIHFEIHAIYEPEENGWYCAAVDLFKPGLTFKLYFTLENGEISVRDLARWWFG